MATNAPGGEGPKPARGGTPGRKAGKVSGGGRRPGVKTLRVQYHLGETTVERLGVHASLVHADRSRVVEEILLGWLSRWGRGRELFGPPEDPEGPGDGQGTGP